MGPKFIWRGPIFNGGQRIYECLNRTLCTDKLRLFYLDGYVKVLSRLNFSYYHPLRIRMLGNVRKVNNPSFGFESA